MSGELNLTKYLSTGGVASRRKCADIIKGGLVRVNGEVVIQPGFRVEEGDFVEVDGVAVKHEQRVYVMLNKPSGYWCTSEDPYADKLAVDLIDIPGVRLYSAGRLDRDSEGLIIFTNDGDYAEKLAHPRYEVLKQYYVETYTALADDKLSEIRRGIVDDREKLKPYKVEALGKASYRFILNEGKKREIRRLVVHAGGKVKLLRRTSIGKLQLDNLKPGKWRRMTPEEISDSLTNPRI